MKHYWFLFYRDRLLLQRSSDGTSAVPLQETSPVQLPDKTTVHNIEMPDGHVVRTATLMSDSVGEGYELFPLRSTYGLLPPRLYRFAGKCREILHWDVNTHYCGICGAPMQMHTSISKLCTRCGNEVWPTPVVAVIVLISRGDSILLVRAKNFTRPFFGLVAGFVETGETLEEAVCREVHEEVGLAICNLRYVQSQPWPYPCGIMVGFRADYSSGQLILQQSEIAEAQWATPDHLPLLPEKLSIARKLIDGWLQEKKNLEYNQEEK